MKSFFPILIAVILGTAIFKYGYNKAHPTEASEKGQVWPAQEFQFPTEELVEQVEAIGNVPHESKLSKRHRGLASNQKDRVLKKKDKGKKDKSKKDKSKKSKEPTFCDPTKSSKKQKGCIEAPVAVSPLAPVASPVAAPVGVPFYVPVTEPASPPVASPIAVTLTAEPTDVSSPTTVTTPTTTSLKVPVAAPVGSSPTTSAPAIVSTAGGTSAPAIVSTAGGTSAPAVVSTAGGTVAPASTPVATPVAGPTTTIYVEATAQDCVAVSNGDLVQGQTSLTARTFTFGFNLVLTTGSTNVASVIATARLALQALVAQGIVDCGSRKNGKGKSSSRRQLQSNGARNEYRHHNRARRNRNRHNRNRRNRNRQRRRTRRLSLDLNVIANALFDVKCEPLLPCAIPDTCFTCTSTVDVFLKGPANDVDIIDVISQYLNSPSFLADAGIDNFASSFSATAVAPVVAGTPTTRAGSNGDPHFKSWKGEHFEYHGQCDLVLTKDANFADGIGLDVQIRTKLVRFWSYIKSAAVRIGDDILEVEGSSDFEQDMSSYWINFDLQAKQRTIGGFPLAIFDDHARPWPKRRFEIDLSSKYPGQKIVIGTFKEFVKVDFVEPSAESMGRTVGMLGDFRTGLTYGRDRATVIDDFNELGSEWQVHPADDMMLFHDISDPQFPKPCLLPEDPRGQRRRLLKEGGVSEEDAEAACSKNLSDALDIKDCVYDIIATQDMDMVGAY